MKGNKEENTRSVRINKRGMSRRYDEEKKELKMDEEKNKRKGVENKSVDNKRFKDRLVGIFQHCSRRLILLLPPNEFLHSSPEVPRTIQAGETSASEGRNYYRGI